MAAREFRAVVLWDRDGTLIEERDYLAEPEGVVLLPGAAEALRLLATEGVACVLTTNQSGLARGYFTEEQLDAVHARLDELLTREGARLDAWYWCGSMPDAGDPRRKPATGMYEDACRDMGVAGLPVFAIGDRLHDVEFARRCAGTGILVHTGQHATDGASAAEIPLLAEPVGLARKAPRAIAAQGPLEGAELVLWRLLLEDLRDDAAVARKLLPLDAAGRAVAARKGRGQCVVMANGTFDLMHGGHISYLEDARRQGDALIVGVNSDESIRGLKGPTRPILPLRDRVQLLCALECVDLVTVFHERTADRLLRTLLPSAHAKGTDYTKESVPERETNAAMGIDTIIAGDPKENSSRDIIRTVIERFGRGGAAGA